MPDITLLRVERVLERRGRSRSVHYRDVASGLMTPPVHAASIRKIALWPAHEIDAITRAEIAGASQDEIRALVHELIEQRKEGRQQAAA